MRVRIGILLVEDLLNWSDRMKTVIFACCLLTFVSTVVAQKPQTLNYTETDWRELAMEVCDMAEERTLRWNNVLPRPNMRWRKSLPFYSRLLLDVIWLVTRIERAGYSKEKMSSDNFSPTEKRFLQWGKDPSLEKVEKELLYSLVIISSRSENISKVMLYFQKMGIQEEAYDTLHRILDAYQQEVKFLSEILETEYVPGTCL